MNRLAVGLEFVWGFVVGDDWRIAAGVLVGLAAAALLGGAGVAAWWLLPPIVGGMLALSVATAARGNAKEADGR